jgi:hypothetical protein
MSLGVVRENANLGLIRVLNSHKEKRRILRAAATSEKLLLKPQGEVNCGQKSKPKLTLRDAVLAVQTLSSCSNGTKTGEQTNKIP